MELDDSGDESEKQYQDLNANRESHGDRIDCSEKEINADVGDDFDDFEAGAEDEDFGDFDEGFEESSSPRPESPQPQPQVSALPPFTTREPSLVSNANQSRNSIRKPCGC